MLLLVFTSLFRLYDYYFPVKSLIARAPLTIIYFAVDYPLVIYGMGGVIKLLLLI